MQGKQMELSYFLDFLNNDIAIWSIRVIVIVSVLLMLGNYYYKHYKYKKWQEEREGGQ